MNKNEHDETCQALTHIIERSLRGHCSHWVLVVSHPHENEEAVYVQTYANSEDPLLVPMLRAAAKLLDQKRQRAAH